MNKEQKNWLIIGVVVIIVLIVFYMIAGSSPQEETIKIGAILPLTGIASIHGQNERQGIDLAVKEINEAGGINGKPIEIIYEDDQTNPAKSLISYNKLIDVNGVEVVIGGTWDILANAIIPESEKKQVVILSPSALPDTLEQESPYFFSMHSPVAVNQEVFEKFIIDNAIERVGIIVVNNPWGLAHLDTFKKAIENTDATVVEERILQSFDNNDISTDLSILKDLDVDSIFVTINFNDMALFGKKRIELGIGSKILAHSNFASSIEAGRLSIELSEGVTIFRFSEPSQEFIEKFSLEYGKTPEIYSDIAYDTVYVIKNAIEKYGYSSDGIIRGLREVDLSGTSGQIYFGNNNYPANKQPVLEIISNGEFVVLE
ncbi:MAG: ABC transporter substrate-binding protein [Nanoarchaeota archaeon]|nr:ABC transporter substrate-binding protein [Nanoarchaeota archaeon]